MAMIEFKNNQQIDAYEAARLQAEKEARERQTRPIITGLSSYLMSLWVASEEAKRHVEKVLIESLQQLRGEYDSTKLAEIKDAGAPETFMMLTDEKCSAVSSWISDILFPGSDKPWGIKPTPVPDLNPAQVEQIKGAVIMEMQNTVQQELILNMQSGQITDQAQAQQFVVQTLEARAQEVAREIREEMEAAAKSARDRIETKLHDVVIESGWEEAVSEAIDDVVIFKAGIVKGPVLRKKKRLKWNTAEPVAGSEGMDQGYQPQRPSAVVSEEVSIDFNRVSPFDVYPLPNSKTPQDGMIERHRLSRKYLTSLVGVPGYDEDAIKLALQDYGKGGGSWLILSIDNLRQQLEDRPDEWRSPEQNIDALQFWVNIQGLLLLSHGMSPEDIQDPFADYPVEVWLVGRYVIKAEINGDPLGRVPYNFASFRKRPGSIWGSGVPEIIRDSQSACNAAARAILANMGISSGPQVMVDQSQLPPGARVTSLYPWKVWLVNRNLAFGGSSSNRPVDFFVPPSVAGELISVYQFFSNEADNKTGVPKYSYGGESKGSAGALDTATGFTTMMSNATRGIKRVIKNIDKGIIEPSITRTHEFQLLMFNDPEYAQGDIKIIAKGSTAMIAKEQSALRRNELLGIVTSRPAVLDIIGKTGLASMLREIFALADFKDDDIVPDKKTMEMRGKQEQQMLLDQQSMEAEEDGPNPGKKKLDQKTDSAGNKAGGADVRVV